MKSQFMHVELYSREEPAKKTINKSKNINHKSDVRTTTVNGVLSEMKREGRVLHPIFRNHSCTGGALWVYRCLRTLYRALRGRI